MTATVRNCPLTPEQILAAVKKHGSERAAAKALGFSRTTFQDWHRKVKQDILTARRTKSPVKIAKPRKGDVKRFIFTSAQDGTKLHEPFWANLRAYADYVSAEIHVAGFTYAKSLYTNHVKQDAVYHEAITPYLTNRQFDVGGKLLFCGEQNTLPTAVHPLSGFETYTRSKWGVFPHPRVTLESVATMFNEPSKILMTTGAVTLPNYIPKKAGIRAEFHHVIGAVIVELDADGDIFCRHLLAEKDGSFQDLWRRVENGTVTEDHRVEAITWGDIHHERLDPVVEQACWGVDIGDESIVDILRPKYQFIHDAIDFQARTHHSIKDPHHRYDMWVHGQESVADVMGRLLNFLYRIERDDCKTIIVESNHDKMLGRWLREADYRHDPANAEFFLRLQARTYAAIKERDDRFSPLEAALRELDDRISGGALKAVFLRESDSYIICPQAGGGIECALHGHKGANGAKGHIYAFAKMGPKANVAHTHAAAIFEGIYQAGTCSKLDLGYNRGGLSSWNHSHIVTYPSGKRVILTMQAGKAWA
jgi:transposase